MGIESVELVRSGLATIEGGAVGLLHRPSLLLERMALAYRRSGAELPGGDPRPTHGAAMEGWFWRFTDVARGRVVVALCGVNQHRDGAWATVALAEYPSGLVRTRAAPGAQASAERFEVRVPGILTADERSLRVDLDDMHLDVAVHDLVGWPLRLGGGGIFSVVPFLNQYWHPHVLGGTTTGNVVSGDQRWTLDGANVYAEKNWGAGFPDRWWWGQAQGFGDRSVCVAFGGGRLAAGPLGLSVTGCVVRLGNRVVRFAPPFSAVRAFVGDGRWTILANRPGWTLTVEADGNGHVAAVLPVPLPAERRNVGRDFEHLAGRLRLRVLHRGSTVFDGESLWAALEVGAASAAEASSLAAQFGVPANAVT